MNVAIVMGSDSDLPIVKKSVDMLKKFDIPYTVNVISAHRTPDRAADFAKNARANGTNVIIAAAGKAAHLAGVIAAFTTLPVIGLPIKSSTMDGLDSLLSTVQMPKGIPVATVAIDGAENAAILAIEILALNNDDLTNKLIEFKQDMSDTIEKIDKGLDI
ncbi:MAG: 5-(carboxyamino)imidazole ribonucleotide mutase [Clostridiales bacterium]|nr:5-(carboxyamino)imidazole ribonucleotide mutase [Clostridiales bacterium]